ncbi:unnamed protein product [marine sediment metagenome]|uniref:Uncharacterized protein n=1 Tax=marine sediment metagenome TaxID=412755 RepID=X1LZ93_9ZZZZ
MPKGISEAGKESRKAISRYYILHWHERKNRTVKQTCSRFGITRRKFFLWKKRKKEYEKFLETLPSPEKVQKFLEKTRWYWLLSPRLKKNVKLNGEPEEYIEEFRGKRRRVKRLSGLPSWYAQLELSRSPKRWPRK